MRGDGRQIGIVHVAHEPAHLRVTAVAVAECLHLAQQVTGRLAGEMGVVLGAGAAFAVLAVAHVARGEALGEVVGGVRGDSRNGGQQRQQ